MELDNIEEVKTKKDVAKDFTHIEIKSEDNEKEEKPSKPRFNFKKQLTDNWMLIGGIIIFTLVLIVLIVLSVVLTRKSVGGDPENQTERVDCVPWLKGKSQHDIYVECHKQENCLYLTDPDPDGPMCIYDNEKLKLKRYTTEKTSFGEKHLLSIPDQVETKAMFLEFEYLDDVTLRFKVYDAYNKDYEVPIEIFRPEKAAENPKYQVELIEVGGNFEGFKIIRKSTGTALWDTNYGSIIFEKFQRLITTKLPSTNVYGLGENLHTSLKHDFNYRNWPVFARDQIAEDMPGSNLYGSQPFYTCMENDGHSHGVVLVNSNALDYEFIPEPALTYRASGGILDFYMFLGPEPENVVQQFTQYFGRTFMPPYWALGFQISRYGYKNLDDMKAVLKRFQEHDIPLDTQVADIDHYDERKDFTVDPVNWAGLADYFKYLKEVGMRTVMILDPAIIVNETNYWPYDTARETNVFIEWPGFNPDYSDTNSSIMVGYCWPKGKVAYPDFFRKSTQKWWIDSIARHYKDLPFDGLWIDMNEPAVFGTNEERAFNWPEKDKPYWTLNCPDDEREHVKTKSSYLHRDGNKLSDKTLCMNAVQGENGEYIHFDVHNLYGLSESKPTFEAARKVTGTRGFVISRSTFLGSGKYGGHWTGDNHSLWTHLRYSIIGMLEFNMFGIPYVGADICGFFGKSEKELCARWMMLGAFYPFSRNHNGIGEDDQDPGAYDGTMVANAAKYALDIRYTILPYYYTLFYKAHKFGNTVTRPLHFEFPRDNQTYEIDRQFMVGPAVLVTPCVEKDKDYVTAYFPTDNWYNYDESIQYFAQSFLMEDKLAGEYKELPTPIDHINVHIRGGYIVPTQEPANTTHFARMKPFGLIVAPNSQGEAEGDLFYDDGISDSYDAEHFYATFQLRDNKLRMNIEKNDYDGMQSLKLDKLRIFIGSSDAKDLKFVLNQNIVLNDDSTYKISMISTNEMYQVVITGLNLPMDKEFELKWSAEKPFTANSKEGTIIDCSMQSMPLNETACRSKGCQYHESKEVGTPTCFIPSGMGGYTLSQTDGGNFKLKKADKFKLIEKGKPIENLNVLVRYGVIDGQYRMANLKIVDQDSADRYQVPVPLNYADTEYNKSLDIEIGINSANSFRRAQFVVKNSRGDSLFDTINTEQGFVYDDQLIQMVMNIHYQNVYGMGENTHHSFRHEFSYTNWWGVFARDQPTGGKQFNNYGTHPFFMAVNKASGRALGVLIKNSNAQEYGFLPPSALAYRTLGGILDLYIMEESSPELLIKAYTSLIGKPYMPPYWALGFQLCKYGYNSLENLQKAVDRTMQAEIPMDIQYADIDHFEENLDFTYDQTNFKGLPEYIRELKGKGIHFIIILDPAINAERENYSPYANGKDKDVYIKWPKDSKEQVDELGGNNEYMLGYVWPNGKAVFPDFFKNKTKNWWKDEIMKHYQTVPFDGLWIDMNEPANFDTNKEKPWNWPVGKPAWNLVCPSNNSLDNPPYLPLVATMYGPETKISDKTLCMIGRQGETDQYNHYDVHNLYGWSQTEPTLQAARETLKKRSIVISRSTYPSSGHYAGHWLGDNQSQWKHLKLNIIGLLEFNLFGIPYIGADICGFFNDATPEMCTRWMQIGAFQTFYRNHNGFDGIDQDPLALGKDVAAASKAVNEIRYSLLPFLYSKFYEVNQNGGSIIRSLMHEFPTDPRALDIDRQFMWGSELLISPVLDKNKRTVYAYFPQARWFDYYSGVEVEKTGRAYELDAPLDHIPLHIRAGSLILTQKSGLNTIESRKNPYGLIVTPPELNASNKLLKTSLFVDDGDVIDYESNSSIFEFTFDFTNNKELALSIRRQKNKYSLLESNSFDSIRLLGVESKPTEINIQLSKSTKRHYDFGYNNLHKELFVNNLKIKMHEQNMSDVKVLIRL